MFGSNNSRWVILVYFYIIFSHPAVLKQIISFANIIYANLIPIIGSKCILAADQMHAKMLYQNYTIIECRYEADVTIAKQKPTTLSMPISQYGLTREFANSNISNGKPTMGQYNLRCLGH